MDLNKQLHPACVLARLRPESKKDLLCRQVDAIHKDLQARDSSPGKDVLLEAVLAREDEDSTGLGRGIAFPHARIPNFMPFCLSIATLADPLPFDAIDENPVWISCLVIAPADSPNLLLKVWSCLTSFLMQEDVRNELLCAQDNASLYETIQQHHLEIDATLTAGDIMAPVLFEIQIDTPLPRITNLMYRHREPATAVLDKERRIIGEITSDAVFQYGMPDFFTRLQSVGFIRHFNPLEKYFADEADMLAGDIMADDYAAVDRSATLLEVLFQLSIKRRTKVYVVDDEKRLVGVIGRLSILNRAINF